jgi:hypothetical protein
MFRLSRRSTICLLAWSLSVSGFITLAAQEPPPRPAAPDAPTVPNADNPNRTSDPAPQPVPGANEVDRPAPSEIEKLTQAVESLKLEVGGLRTVIDGQKDLVNDLQRDVKSLKTPTALAGAVPGAGVPRAAVVGTPPAPGPREATEPTAVPANFWTIDAAQRLGLYRFEPRIKEATTMVSEVFGLAANEAAAAQTPEELEQVPAKYRALFLKKLEDSGRTELTVQTWGNAVDAWLSFVNQDLLKYTQTADANFEGYRDILVAALRDGQKNALPWGEAIDQAHDDARGGATAAASGRTSAGTASGGAYLPPLAAFHQAWHVRKVRRWQGRISAYSR